MKYTNRWEMPEVWFYQVEGHGFDAHEGRPLYAYGKPDDMDDRGIPKTGELYASLDRALIAWVGEKYTGPRGAGGTGVGTAADWFMRMIGADEVVPVDRAQGLKALGQVIEDTREESNMFRADAMADALKARGLVLAALNHGK